MTVRIGSIPGLEELLGRHPEVDVVGETAIAALEFGDRAITIGNSEIENAGLIELMDNNPLVCAKGASVPDAASTLALIAVGPLLRATILVEEPALLYSFEVDEDLVRGFLKSDAAIQSEVLELDGVLALTALATLNTADFRGVDELFEEAYGRSFFVRRDESSTWDPALVIGRPWACYRMAMTAEDDQSFVSIKVISDSKGKCGAAQIIHMMNVMCGYEESLGLQ